jgi:hypothetical protein
MKYPELSIHARWKIAARDDEEWMRVLHIVPQE